MIAGDGSLRGTIEHMIKDAGLEAEVRLLGRRGDIDLLFAASDVFALSSLWEGMPNALLEAMAWPLPVIATRVGGIPEVIMDRETGVLVDAADSSGLASAIALLMDDEELKRQVCEEGKKLVHQLVRGILHVK